MNYAGFWIRVGAYIIDAIVLYMVSFVIGMVTGMGMMSMGALGDPDAATGAMLISNLLGIVIGWLYFAIMESSARQGTLGKMALGLTVTDAHGHRISFLRATGRYFGKILSALVLMIGFIMVAFTERKQGLHDLLASTLVLKAAPGAAMSGAEVFE